ncbi:hypothetical protein LshimejAT787_0409320 [Lyophyllum shimeji]|uniref:Uncharacterized protein n=1 Tax=Lyophyllum shimeji TaxID=47721 RepID=A0A9P3PLH5_LYOSH|nr:hypothetical protein LshimejAT787_0409320 [Lyophyllum shimeji]
MVKRPKSPDAAEDEKYFTVYQPYPLNANWELPQDYITFSRWIAACIGTDPIHALHYKPSARGMVLIEVDKRYPHNERLLGEHRWSEMLKNPTDEEGGRVTQIFHCLYTTGREAQKDGWKRIHVEAAWFKDWTPTTDFQDPYPTTYWCPTPPEDKTNKPLCRPLPVAVKPPPPKVVPPVVGSENWVSAKGAAPPTTQALQGAWAAKAKKAASPANTKATAAAGKQSPRSAVSAKSPSAWNKPIIQSSPTACPPPSPCASLVSATAAPNAWSTAGSKNGSSPATTSNQAPAFPPGLVLRVPPGQSLPAPPGLTKPSTSDASSSSGSSLEAGATEKALSGLFEENVTISLSPSQDRALYGLAPEQSPELGAEAVIHPWEQTAATFEKTEWQNAAASDAGSQDLWGEETGEAKKPAVALCPYHAHTCKKGVCTWRAKQVKEEERQAALAKKKNEAATKGANGGKAGAKQGSWRQNSSASSETTGDDDGFSRVGGRNKGRRNGR